MAINIQAKTFRKEIATNARAFFSKEKMAKNYYKLYESIL